MRSLVKIKVKVKGVESDGNFAADDTSTCLGLSTCLKTKWTAKMSMSSRIRPIRTPPPIVRYLRSLSCGLLSFPWFAQLLRATCLICKPVSELRVRSKRNGGAVKGVSHPTCWKFFLAPGDGVGGGRSDGRDDCNLKWWSLSGGKKHRRRTEKILPK